MGGRSWFLNGLGAALLFASAAPAPAQFSDSYNFIKAVKDRDGDKAMEQLNKPGQPTLNARDGDTGQGALHIVVRRHDFTWLQFLLSRKPQVDLRDRDGNTALLIAAQVSDPEAARALITAGANVNAGNSRGETALIVAVQRRDIVTVRQLVAAGANPKLTDSVAGKSARGLCRRRHARRADPAPARRGQAEGRSGEGHGPGAAALASAAADARAGSVQPRQSRI